MKRAISACAAFLAVYSATAQEVVQIGQDTYRIVIPTKKMGVLIRPVPEVPRAPDVGAAGNQALMLAIHYCVKMNKAMIITDGEFNMGSGLSVIFRCVTTE